MKLPYSELRTFIYNRLKDGITYAGKIVPVYSIPNSDATPFIRIGDLSMTENGTKDYDMPVVTANIEVVTKFSENLANYAEADAIANNVSERLIDYTGETTSFGMVWAHFLGSQQSESLVGEGIEIVTTITIEYYLQQKS